MRPFPDPSILLHPQIPKPLHLLSPRTILGTPWWDVARKEAYVRHEFHCHACGVLKYEATHRQWLEGHEMYDIDYVTGRVEFVEVVALCHFCHNYIHSGRMEHLVSKGKMGLKMYDDITKHGERVLRSAGLPLDLDRQLLSLLHSQGVMCGWEDYHLVIDGVRYERRFRSAEEWQEYWIQVE